MGVTLVRGTGRKVMYWYVRRTDGSWVEVGEDGWPIEVDE